MRKELMSVVLLLIAFCGQSFAAWESTTDPQACDAVGCWTCDSLSMGLSLETTTDEVAYCDGVRWWRYSSDDEISTTGVIKVKKCIEKAAEGQYLECVMCSAPIILDEMAETKKQLLEPALKDGWVFLNAVELALSRASSMCRKPYTDWSSGVTPKTCPPCFQCVTEACSHCEYDPDDCPTE